LAVPLYWLPLGAGGHFVRLNGRVYEALAARVQRRPARDLYHSALQVELPEGTFVIEQAPVHDWSGNERGVVAEGAVGARWAGRFRIFRYEIRLWRGGHIPDVAEAVDSPRRLSDQERAARRVLEVVPRVPTPVWGRDELGTGEMWNSNAVIAWVIARSGIDAESIEPPQGGRAPGWQAGVAVARRRDAEGTGVAKPLPAADRRPLTPPRLPTLREPTAWGLHPTARPRGTCIGCPAGVSAPLRSRLALRGKRAPPK
jgi:hypothetical protein